MIADAGGTLYACKATVDMFQERGFLPSSEFDHQRRPVLRDLGRRTHHFYLTRRTRCTNRPDPPARGTPRVSSAFRRLFGFP